MNDSVADPLYRHVRDFLLSVIQGDATVISQLGQCGEDIYFTDGVLHFRLQGLHQLLLGNTACSYQQFKAMLYASGLNAELARWQYRVEVASASGKVDSSWYRLVAID